MMILLTLHAFSTAFMTGVIWFVQLVHYPSFLSFDPSKFSRAMNRNQWLTTVVVFPVMLCEVFTWIALASTFSSAVPPFFLWANSIALVAILGITFFMNVPRHQRLLLGYDESTIRSLVNSNWPRTLLWTGRSLGLFFLLRAP